jgi:hypothetical protein
MPDNKVPTITSANVPRPQPPPPPVTPRAEDDDTGIVAKPLTTPAFTEVHSKNPNLRFRYGNRTAGDPPGMQIEYWLGAGFRVATPADCTVEGLEPRDNKFIKGDLLLLCTSREDYLGALKLNREKAFKRMNKDVVRASGRGEIAQQIRGVSNLPADLGNKLSVFTPSDAQVAGLVGDTGVNK